jgi:hypothetical protein
VDKDACLADMRGHWVARAILIGVAATEPICDELPARNGATADVADTLGRLASINRRTPSGLPNDLRRGQMAHPAPSRATTLHSLQLSAPRCRRRVRMMSLDDRSK